MVLRMSKCALLFGVALFFALVVFNNISDYDANLQFVRHVLSMDSTLPGNHGMWRALAQPWVHRAFYLSILCAEVLICLLCWVGLWRLLVALRSPATVFARSKSLAVVALTLGCLLWLVAFLDVGGEWFLMWQSKVWNGQEAAFRMFTVLCLLLIYLTLPEGELGEARPPVLR